MKTNIIFIVIICAFLSCKKDDLTAPVIELNGSSYVRVELYGTYTEPGAKAYDETDGDISSTLEIENDINANMLGKYYVRYSATDKSGNTCIKKRIVDVVYVNETDTLLTDTIAPKLYLYDKNPYYIHLDSTFNDPGAIAIDNIYGNISNLIAVESNVNEKAVGTYLVTYSITDFAGNSASIIRNVKVISDNNPPTLNLFGYNPQKININESYVEQGAEAIDLEFGNISWAIVIEHNINTSVAGTYSVSYKVADEVGNVAIKTRQVQIIQDNNPPTITLLGSNPITIPRSGIYKEPGFTAADAEWGDLTGLVKTSNNIVQYQRGTYQVNYTVEDYSGNMGTATRTVIIGF